MPVAAARSQMAHDASAGRPRLREAVGSRRLMRRGVRQLDRKSDQPGPEGEKIRGRCDAPATPHGLALSPARCRGCCSLPLLVRSCRRACRLSLTLFRAIIIIYRLCAGSRPSSCYWRFDTQTSLLRPSQVHGSCSCRELCAADPVRRSSRSRLQISRANAASSSSASAADSSL